MGADRHTHEQIERARATAHPSPPEPQPPPAPPEPPAVPPDNWLAERRPPTPWSLRYL